MLNYFNCYIILLLLLYLIYNHYYKYYIPTIECYKNPCGDIENIDIDNAINELDTKLINRTHNAHNHKIIDNIFKLNNIDYCNFLN